MRIEVRKTDGPTCVECGATELVHTKLGAPLLFDAGRVFARERKQLEAELRAEFQAKLDELSAAAGARAYAARVAITDLEAHHESLHGIAAEGIQQLLGKEYSKIRFRARGRQRKLLAEAQPLIEQLLADTRKV